MNRRHWMACAAAAAAGAWCGLKWAGAAEPEVDLKAMRVQLVQGLRVTTDSQRAYIDRVILLVGQKKLSASLVYSIYKWSRKRYPRLPFVYFRRALDLMARKQGIVI